MNSRSVPKGFTLVELMITLVVVITLTLVGVPQITKMVDKNRVVAATEAIHAQFVMAKSEAFKRSQTTYVRVVESGGDWWIGVGESATCNPALTDATNSSACRLSYVASGGTLVYSVRAIDNSMYPGVDVDADTATFAFEPVRGTATEDDVEIESTTDSPGYETQLEVSALGRLRLCSPTGSGNVGRYPGC